jgi:hypothetical protein
LFQINDPVGRRIWDLAWRYGQAVDAVTWLGEEFVDPIREVMDGEQLPIGHLIATKPHLLARELAYRPDIVAVHDPDPTHAFTYGSKGRHTDPHRPHFL